MDVLRGHQHPEFNDRNVGDFRPELLFVLSEQLRGVGRSYAASSFSSFIRSAMNCSAAIRVAIDKTTLFSKFIPSVASSHSLAAVKTSDKTEPPPSGSVKGVNVCEIGQQLFALLNVRLGVARRGILLDQLFNF
ncbi:hypothetical protein [Bradyrhizobium sp. AC87j1]|uniref:hypothetical protein n=1 Tax=Bradyrhizobium sp. AC87j1 TaxID=2055894 RepID=UPI0011B0C26C|nr:hypothetical protein [Bradyrhizobium sp. AC87j1]